MPKHRKTTIAIFTLVLLSIACLAIVIVFGDAPPPDDADLMPTRLDIPDEENAFTHLERARAVLYWPRADENRLDDVIEGFLPDFDLARDVIDRNAETFKHLDAALACKHCQVPEIEGPDTPLPYLSDWRALVDLSVLRAALLHHTGNEQAAFDQVLTAVRLGHVFETCRGGMCIHHMVSNMAKQSALARLRNMLPQASLPKETLRRISDELRNYYADSRALAETCRNEYVLACQTVDAVKANGINMGEGRSRRVFGHLLQPNKTKRLIADFCRTEIRNFDRPFETQRANLLELSPRSDAHLEFPVYLLQMNATGKLLATDLLYPTYLIPRLKSCNTVDITATRLLIALRSYELATGALPDSLNVLVPDFIEAIPIDDYDGKPLRYSPRERAVYSQLSRPGSRKESICYHIGGRAVCSTRWDCDDAEQLEITFYNTDLTATWLVYSHDDLQTVIQTVIAPADGTVVTLTDDEAHVEDDQGFVHVPGAGVYLYDPAARAFKCLAEKVDAAIMTADGPDAARREYLLRLLGAAKAPPQP